VNRRDRLFVTLAAATIAAAGVAFRLLCHRAIYGADPVQGGLILDTLAYENDARAMLAAGSPLEPPVSFRPPGYPWFLAGLYGLGLSPRGVVSVQAALDGASALVLAATAAAIFRAAWPSLLAAFLVAASPVLAYFSGERLETSLMVFLVSLHVAALVAAVGHGGAARFALAGATLGAAAVVRPNVLLFAPLLAVAAHRAGRVRALLCAAAGVLVLVLPVTAKNLFKGGELVLVSANGGVNLYVGNVPDPEIQDAIPYFRHLPGPVPGWPWAKLERRAAREGGPTLSEQSSWHARRALARMAAHPLRTAALLGKKIVALAGAFELSNNRDVYRAGSPLGALPLWIASWGVVAPLALLGLVAALRRGGDARLRWVALLALALALSVALFFVASRHRAPLLPAMVLLAAGGVASLRPLAWSRVAILAIAAVVVNVDWLSHRSLYAGYEIDPVGIGTVWQGLGRDAEAEAAFTRALGRDPRDPLALLKLGSLRNEQGRFAAAEPLLRQSAEIDPIRRESWNNLGLALAYQRRAAEALEAFERALALDPGYALALVNRGRAKKDLGDRAGAREDLEAALRLLDPADPIVPRVRELLR